MYHELMSFRFCPHCGSKLQHGDVPNCPNDGPVWVLARNAPCADVMIIRDTSFLAVKRAHEPYFGYWAMPGGHLNLGEAPADAAIREAKEETGVHVKLGELLGTYIEPVGAGQFHQTSVYLATIPADAQLDASEESSSVAWFSIDRPPENLVPHQRQRLTDYLRLAPKG